MSKSKVEKDIEVPDDLLKELLTESELRMVKQRAYIIKLLARGLSIRAVATRAQVGTDTVVRMAKKLNSSPLLKKTFENINPSLQSKWVYGQNDSKE